MIVLGRRKCPSTYSLMLMIVVLFISSLGTSQAAKAQEEAAYYRLVRKIETADFGVPTPAGLAHIPAAEVFLVSPRHAGRNAADLVGITIYEDPAGVDRLAITIPSPLNLAFDAAANRLLLLDVAQQELVAIPARADGRFDGAGVAARYNARGLGLGRAGGLAVNPHNGRLFLLDAGQSRIFGITPDAQGGLDVDQARREGRLSEIDLKHLGRGEVRGVAFDPSTGHLFVLSRAKLQLYELDEQGQLIATRELAEIDLRDPQGIVAAPSGDPTDDPSLYNVFILDSGHSSGGGTIAEIELNEPQITQTTTTEYSAVLVQTIHTSQWSPPSPDPAGLAYLSASQQLMVADSEVDEMAIFEGVNIFESSLQAKLGKTHNTLAFSKEPTGVAFNPSNGHYFFSDDGQKQITEVAPGNDGVIGTADDTVISFSTRTFNCRDPEGIAYANGKLYIADGLGREIWILRPGPNGVFDGVAPDGDDTVSSFDTSGLGQQDPEGVEFSSGSNTLYIVSNDKQTNIAEVSESGGLVSVVDVSALNVLSPGGLTYAPGSQSSTENHIYVVDRGVDNNDDPNENDGKIYEIGLEQAPPRDNLLDNPSFELDNDNNGAPDSWSNNSMFRRSSEVVHSGSYAGTFSASDDSRGTVKQIVYGLSGGVTYPVSLWVNIPPTTDSFAFKFKVRWRDANNNNLGTDVIKTYKTDTGGMWDQASADLVAPSGTASAIILLNVSSLNGTIYVDDAKFGP